jgi:type IV pilus assembly protein PilY1
MYGLVDDGTEAVETDLQMRDIAIVDTLEGRSVRAFQASAPLPAGKRGWFVDLDAPRAGERIVVRPQVRGSALVTSSMIPPTPSACDAGGSGYLNAIDAFTGTALAEVYFDVNGDGVFDNADKLGSGRDAIGVGSIDVGVGNPTKATFIGDMATLTGSNGTLAEQHTNGQGGIPRRVLWREILQD